jgi:hypothetical protein
MAENLLFHYFKTKISLGVEYPLSEILGTRSVSEFGLFGF